jgi:hypothetical protein
MRDRADVRRRSPGRRVLAPDLYESEDQLVLTIYVTPESGFQVRRPNPEMPVRVALGHPVGHRELIDGVVYGEALGRACP